MDISLDTLEKHRRLLPFIKHFPHIQKEGDKRIVHKTRKSGVFKSVAAEPETHKTTKKEKVKNMLNKLGKSRKSLNPSQTNENSGVIKPVGWLGNQKQQPGVISPINENSGIMKNVGWLANQSSSQKS